jgi:hypothetical protein
MRRTFFAVQHEEARVRVARRGRARGAVARVRGVQAAQRRRRRGSGRRFSPRNCRTATHVDTSAAPLAAGGAACVLSLSVPAPSHDTPLTGPSPPPSARALPWAPRHGLAARRAAPHAATIPPPLLTPPTGKSSSASSLAPPCAHSHALSSGHTSAASSIARRGASHARTAQPATRADVCGRLNGTFLRAFVARLQAVPPASHQEEGRFAAARLSTTACCACVCPRSCACTCARRRGSAAHGRPARAG